MKGERSVDVVVVGAGIIGSATAWQLSRRGHRVALCEQYALDHVFGSSHGRSRIFRLAYDSPDYVHLARDAGTDWRQVEDEAGRRLLSVTGGFDIGEAREIELVEDALAVASVESRRVSRTDFSSELPKFSIRDGWHVLYQPDAGVLAARECIEAFDRLAKDNGAQILHHRRVLSLIKEDDHVGVETDEGAIRAETVVVCAGGWAASLLRPLGIDIPIRVTREHVAYYPALDPPPLHPFLWHTPDAPEFYGLPRRPDETTTKVGHHLAGDEVVAGSRGEPDHSRIDTITSFVREFIPGLKPSPVLSETCLYATTPDDDFVLDRDGPIVVGVGLGGHGFKFAPRIAAMLADLVDGKSIPFASRFALARFEQVAARAG